MIKLLLKTTIFTLLLSSFATISKAQLGYNYAQYDIGFGGIVNKVYGDAEYTTRTPSGYVNFTYNHTPFVNYVAEFQAGILKGGHPETASGRYFKNAYKSLVLRGQLQAGEFLNYSRSPIFNVLKNFYVSSGFGYVVNDITEVNRESLVVPDFYTGGEDKSSELYIPARLGYELKIFNRFNEPSVKIDLGVQYNYVFGDNLDGFKAGVSNDTFFQYSIGIKFALGGLTSAGKQISY
jgi:hypothetical protein